LHDRSIAGRLAVDIGALIEASTGSPDDRAGKSRRASGALATEAVAKAAPDGYTLGMATSTRMSPPQSLIRSCLTIRSRTSCRWR
jgi:hypothetical protein